MNVTSPRFQSRVLFGSSSTPANQESQLPSMLDQFAPDYFSSVSSNARSVNLLPAQSKNQQMKELENIKISIDVLVSEFSKANSFRKAAISQDIDKTLIDLSEKIRDQAVHKDLQGKALRLIRYTMHPESIGSTSEKNPQRPKFFNKFHLHPWVAEQPDSVRRELVSVAARTQIVSNLGKAWNHFDDRKKAHITHMVNHHLKNELLLYCPEEQGQPELYDIATFVGKKALPHALKLESSIIPPDTLFPRPKEILRTFVKAAPERFYRLPLNQRQEIAEILDQAKENIHQYINCQSNMGPVPISEADIQQHSAKLAKLRAAISKLSILFKAESATDLPDYEHSGLENGLRRLLS